MGLSALRKDAAVLYYTRTAPSRRKTTKPDRDFGPHAPPLFSALSTNAKPRESRLH